MERGRTGMQTKRRAAAGRNERETKEAMVAVCFYVVIVGKVDDRLCLLYL